MAPRVALRASALGESLLLDLAQVVARELVQEADQARPFVGGQPAGHVIDEVLL
jgi:hypothetical protein